MKKKIIFIITKSNYGGAQRYVYDLATSLSPEQFEILVVLGGNGLLKQKLEEKNIRTISLQSLQKDINIIKELISLKELYSIFRKERPDILHVNSSKAGGLSSFAGRMLGIKKIIFTAHAWAFNEEGGFISRWLITFFHWFTVLLSHTTIAVSHSVKEQISSLPFMNEKIKVIHLGISYPEFVDRNMAQQKLGLTDNSLRVLTVAELHPIKGIRYAIDAMSELREENILLFQKIHYYIIGEGEEKDNLKNYALKKKLSDKITFIGYIKDASEYFKAFDVFLLPSLSEAFGYVLLEAGYAHLPILASNIGGIPEVIEDGITGKLFPPQNSNAIERTLEYTIGNISNANIMSTELEKKIDAKFTLQIMTKRTMDIYTG